jgi:2-amino-4-hydroxy-6-hydroxymethyldihydropteridine diphosphokinase
VSYDPTVQPVPASVVAQVDAADTTLQNPKVAVLSLGSNLGNRAETLQGAIDALEDTPGVRVKKISPVYETEPWGVEPGSQPNYFNAVVVVKTTLPPSSLLERGRAIEDAYARTRTERWGARTIDVDIGRPGAHPPAPQGPPARFRARALERHRPGRRTAGSGSGRAAARHRRPRLGAGPRGRGTPTA